MKFSRITFSFAALAATFVAGAPVLARPAARVQPVSASQNEGEWPTPTLLSSGDVAPSSWAIMQRLDVWAAPDGINSPLNVVLQRMDTLDAPERDEQNMEVRRVASASQSPAFREIVAQAAPSANSGLATRTSTASETSSEANVETAAVSSAVTPPSSDASPTDSPAVVEPAATPSTPAPVKPAATVTTTTQITSTRTTQVGANGTTRRTDTIKKKTVVVSKATVLPGSKKTKGMKVPIVKAAPRRDPARIQSRHKDRILLARLEADLMRANRGLDRAHSTLGEGQKQLMKVGATLRTAMMEAGPDAKGLHPFVRVAMRYAGTPYVWGGESRNGFDCSGFIIVVMRDLGYRALPHSAAEQIKYGIPIAQPLLKPGDIVFFKNTYKPGVSHVGIYLGNRRFINAAGTGQGTIVSSLDEPKWRAKYAGARRLVRS